MNITRNNIFAGKVENKFVFPARTGFKYLPYIDSDICDENGNLVYYITSNQLDKGNCVRTLCPIYRAVAC